ncbi:uncharacterized protein Dwil_GK20614 [Drosophila willistoni]|uniref:Ras-associating domain-containing protein n=1 Tax=Drosophila willistoni TaxID=7260 RepID=B4MXV9_DROWI|nr:uncharacterized protein Dwil_GK20614 [Drosophila willistoni]
MVMTSLKDGQEQQQQHQPENSTFIDDNLDTCPSLTLLNLPESPILPPKQRRHQDANNNNNNQRQRHRSISLYGVNSTVEQGHKEIPIWMDDGEPRYVSGVTNKTTCNDIIKALIDDELKSGNTKKQDGGQANKGSRDYSDYIITESWGGIERSYDGNMAILPVWRAWSRVHNELRISLKRREEFQEPLALQLQRPCLYGANSKKFSMLKWLKKLFQLKDKKTQNATIKPTKTPPKVPNKMKEKCLLDKKQYKRDDFQLILLPDQLYNGKHNCNSKLNKKNKLYQLAEATNNSKNHGDRTRRVRRQSRTEQCNYNLNINNNNLIKRRKDRPLRNSVRNKLASLYADMNHRYEKEYNLTRQLSEKCKLYRQQNEQYNKTEMMEFSVGQLQTNIEAYAEDIIKTEHELLELKNEMKHDISLINNLKRMTLDDVSQTDHVNGLKTKTEMFATQKPPVITQVAKNIAATAQEMQFVDNIYEFCDNNASMLV